MRAQDRYLLTVPARITFEDDGRSLIGNTADMNEHGVRIRCEALQDRDALRERDVVVEIESRDGWVRFEGCVRRVSGNDVGIRFYSDVGARQDGTRVRADAVIPISAPAL